MTERTPDSAHTSTHQPPEKVEPTPTDEQSPSFLSAGFVKALNDGSLPPQQRVSVVQRLSATVGNHQTRKLIGKAGSAASGEGFGNLIIQRQHVGLASGRRVGDVSAVGDNVREDVLQVMDRLHELWSLSDAAYGTEYPYVTGLRARSVVSDPAAHIPQTIAAIRANEQPFIHAPVARNFFGIALSDNVGPGAPNNKNDVIEVQSALNPDYLSNDDYNNERRAVFGHAGTTVPVATIPATLRALTAARVAIAGGNFRRDLMARTRTLTQDQHNRIEAIFTPGATVVPASGGGGATTVVGPPAMTGTGAGGGFETDMLRELRTQVGAWSAEYRRVSAGAQTFPVASANDIARAAQEETERYFAPYLRGASRSTADAYHPGAYSLTSKLGDATTRALDDPQRAGWTEYWMTLSTLGQPIMDRYHCVPTRGGTDETEFARVRDLFVAANRGIIDDTIHNWPAEAGSGTIYLSPYRAFSNSDEERRVRWDLFTTLIHEMMHVLAHPNFSATADTMGGTAQKYLNEGFAEVMRHDLWDGPGRLEQRIASDTALRRRVEGRSYSYNAALVEYHPDYDEYQDALRIDGIVGRPNSKAAFFLGHTELLGIGQGSASSGSLAGIANYANTDAANANVYVVEAGDTYASIQAKTNAPNRGILDSRRRPVDPTTVLSAGTRLIIPGIRWVYAIDRDTLGSIARQNNVPMPELAEANGYPPNVTATLAPSAGTRILIPIH